MSVQLSWTTAMKTPPAVTPLEALSVPAILVLVEMESTVQVRMAILQGCSCMVCVDIYYAVIFIAGQTTGTSFNRHQ